MQKDQGEMTYNKNLSGITYPSDFIPKVKINNSTQEPF
jgi:hypothetical protein